VEIQKINSCIQLRKDQDNKKYNWKNTRISKKKNPSENNRNLRKNKGKNQK